MEWTAIVWNWSDGHIFKLKCVCWANLSIWRSLSAAYSPWIDLSHSHPCLAWSVGFLLQPAWLSRSLGMAQLAGYLAKPAGHLGQPTGHLAQPAGHLPNLRATWPSLLVTWPSLRVGNLAEPVAPGAAYGSPGPCIVLPGSMCMFLYSASITDVNCYDAL